MARPKHKHPTPAELEVLNVLWDRGPATVRDVLEVFQGRSQPPAYTSVMSLLNVMVDKGLVSRKAQGRAFLYEATLPRSSTLGDMVGDLWQRAFAGSASAVVTHLLDQANPTDDELEKIRQAIEAYQQQQGDKP